MFQSGESEIIVDGESTKHEKLRQERDLHPRLPKVEISRL